MSELDKVSGDYRLDLCSMLLESDKYVVIIQHQKKGLIVGQSNIKDTEKLLEQFKDTQWPQQIS